MENLNKHLPLKARIHGYLCGDGSVSLRKEKNKTHSEIRFYPDDLSMARAYSVALRVCYQKVPSIKKLNNYYRVYLNSIIVAKDLLKDGSFHSLEWSIPDWVLENPAYSKEWLRAFFDSEAHVGKREIRIQSVNKRGLLQIQQLLNDLSISSKFYSYQRKNLNWNTNYHLAVFGAKNKNSFLKKIGFNHSIKLRKLIADVA